MQKEAQEIPGEQVASSEEGKVALSLRLFGPFTIIVDGVPTPPLRSRQGHSILALLALADGKPMSRESLAAMLWPDSSPEQALYNLRRNLTDLRHALGTQAARLQSPTPRTLSLDLNGADCDTTRFERYARTDDPILWERAIALYSGTLLDGSTEEWVLPERDRLQQTYLTLLERMAQRCPDGVQRVVYLRQAVAIDPARESAQRALMEALAATGDYNAATLAYRAFRLYLHENLGISPDAETVAAHRRLRAEARARAAGTPASGEPVRESTTLSHPVVAVSGALFGRQRDIGAVTELLEAARLVTLVGPGGIGKTRLALAAAEAVEDDCEDGWVFADLAAVADGTLVPQVVATALGIKEEPNRPITQTLADVLRPRRLLLVLDNCEQILPACARLTEALLRAAPTLRVLATSREPLGLPAERDYAVTGLDLPPARRALTAAELLASPAVQLFADRAAVVAPRFRVDEGNAEAVRTICRELEGIPLALELAAARVRTLTPDEIAAHLGERMRLLTGGSRRAPQRQQTLRALIDWSHDLLAPAERAAFARLSVFAGGWTLEAVEAVIPEESGIERWEVLDLLTSLADKSLIVATEDSTGNTRYRMLETLRAYAREKLEANPTEARTVRARHAAHFGNLAAEAFPHVWGADQGEWLDRQEAEHDNLRAAMDWYVTDPDPASAEACLTLTLHLSPLWRIRMHLAEGRRRGDAALERTKDFPPNILRAKLLLEAGNIAFLQGDLDVAGSRYEEVPTVAEALGDMEVAASGYGSLGNMLQARGDMVGAQRRFIQSLAAFQKVGNARYIATVLTCLGNLAIELGDTEGSISYLEQAVVAAREAGGRELLATSLLSLGESLLNVRGDTVNSRLCLEEALVEARAVGSARVTSLALRVMARVCQHARAFEESERYLRQAVDLMLGAGLRQYGILLLREVASLRAAMGRDLEAAHLWGCAIALCEELAVPPDTTEELRAAEAAAQAEGRGEAFEAARNAGRTLPWEQTLDESLPAATREPVAV